MLLISHLSQQTYLRCQYFQRDIRSVLQNVLTKSDCAAAWNKLSENVENYFILLHTFYSVKDNSDMLDTEITPPKVNIKKRKI